jgi:hypothetical protein
MYLAAAAILEILARDGGATSKHSLFRAYPNCTVGDLERAGDGTVLHSGLKAMVKVGPMKTPAHDRCAFEQLGLGVVNLPKEERAKFTLAVVGPAVMRRLNDAS